MYFNWFLGYKTTMFNYTELNEEKDYYERLISCS